MGLFKRSNVLLSIVACVSVVHSAVIHVNQFGYYPNEKKFAIIVGASADSFSV
ncbi:MAG: hypothetical protein GX640_20495, partial [Fibrobacter sp.]|nr:hypothetical protein [Fibrobacter sp.]